MITFQIHMLIKTEMKGRDSFIAYNMALFFSKSMCHFKKCNIISGILDMLIFDDSVICGALPPWLFDAFRSLLFYITFFDILFFCFIENFSWFIGTVRIVFI